MDAQDAPTMAAQGFRGTKEEYTALLAFYQDATKVGLGGTEINKEEFIICQIIIRLTASSNGVSLWVI